MSEKTKEEVPNENAIRWILNILLIFFIVYMISTCSEDSSTSSTESQPQTIENRFPNVPNLEQESIISKDISEDMLLTMIQIVKLHGNSCDTVSAASASYDGSTFNLKCNLYKYSYNLKDKGGEWHFEVEK